jgi:hypothetical protein
MRTLQNARERLPNRRGSISFNFQCGEFSCVATVSFFPDGRLAEIFLGNGKAGSTADSIAKDAALICSIALQHGVPLEVIRRALLRDAQGGASTVLGCALDHIAGAPPQ